MSKIDYQALRAKAEKATCGVWSLEYGEGRFDGDDALIHREVAGYLPICRIEGAHPESGFDEDFQMEQQANAEFIAAANPATVLALLDERERNQQYIKRRDQENEEIALTVGRLLIENCQLVADTLRHLADNEIDSDYFAITSTNENGTEIDHEMAITDYALEAAGTVDELVAALESAEKRIAELEAEPVSQTYKLNEPSGNSPVTPDGWISCSERMPEETGDIIVVSDGIVMSGISYSRRDGFYMAALEYDDDEPIGGVTHWMPLPEPPQEVNRD
ncbi:ead/Ea22-like family protein [Escherichia coli]